MIRASSRNLAVAFLFTSVAFCASGSNLTAGCGQIVGLLDAAQSAQSDASAQPTASPQKDRTQWRSLHRGMSKDDVRKLLGEPTRVSVSRFYEAWNYPGGTIIFDGKGRLDAWSEL